MAPSLARSFLPPVPSPASGGGNTLQYRAHNTSPPPAPRSRPSALAPPQAPGRDRPDSSLPPAPPAGGLNTLQYPSTRIVEYWRYSSLARLGPAPFSAPLLSASKGAAPPRACSLPSARAPRGGTFLRSVALRFERSRPAARFAVHTAELLSQGAGSPRTPLAPCLRRSARARCTLISLIINRLSHFRASYQGGAPGPLPQRSALICRSDR